MNESLRKFRGQKRDRISQVGIILACLATMVGCQGFSSSKSASVQSQTTTGTLALSGGVLDFGSVTTGKNKTLSMTVSNTGAGSITVSSISISNQAFSLSAPSLPATIAAGQSTPVSVVFSPTAAGAISATVSMVSNASNSPTASFTLAGTGVSSGQLDSNPGSEAFGSVTVGKQSSQTVTLINNSPATVNISQATVSGAAFKLSGITPPVALTPTQSTTLTVTFAPQATGSATGTVTITSDAPNPTLSLALTGTGAAPGTVAANPTSMNFGTVQTGSKQQLTNTLTNTGGSALTISKAGITGTGFTLSGITPPVTLAAGQSTTFNVAFAPLTASSASGTVTVTSDATNPTLTVALSGTGTTVAGQLSASPNPVAIGSVVVGASGTSSGTLTATGANVTVTAAASSNPRFVIKGLTTPQTIPAGQSATFTVTYTPLVAGADSSNLTFTSNAQTTTTADTATGTATPAPVHSVALNWTASTSPNIAGYNIYRAIYTTSCGSFSKINGSTLDTTNAYTDSSVTNGTHYCYATTAVDTTNAESGYSNIVSNVQIPLT